jgi:N-[(2S)-2-amino-2-carboxyethyl]-L-glutamate dehydrogenase
MGTKAPGTVTPGPGRALLYLNRQDVATAAGSSSAVFVEAVTHALALHARRDVVQPLKPYLRRRPDGHIADRIIAMPAYLGGDEPVAGLKWIGSKHDNPDRLGLERASALIVLNDPESHYPIAIMEGGLISAGRTAAVTAVAARHLAREGFSSMACVGCGPIGRTQVLTMGEVVVTATVADRPWLSFAWLEKGCFLSNVSIMDAEKDVFLLADKVVVDDWDQCNREGKTLHQLTVEGGFSRERLHAELGQVVVGTRPGRESDSEIILLNAMGMAVNDVACAQAIYDRARQAGIGTWLSL